MWLPSGATVVWRLHRRGGGVEEAAAAGTGEKGGSGGGDRERRERRDREVRLGLQGGKGLDCGLILRTLRAFFCKIERTGVSMRRSH
jgi:hypothetical protein